MTFRRTGYGLLGLGGVLVLALLVGPHFVNWNAYKDQVTQGLAQATGRTVNLAGDIHLALLPVPTLQVEDVTIGNPDWVDEKTMASLDRLTVHLAIRPLFRGQVKARSIQLDTLRVDLRRTATGQNNWTFQPVDTDPTKITGSPKTDVSNPAASSVDFDVSNVHIVDSRITYHDGTSPVFDISGLELNIDAQSLQGPFAGQAHWQIADIPLTLTFAVGRQKEDGSFGTNIDLKLPQDSGHIQWRGSFGINRDTMLTGTAKIEGDSLGDMVANLAILSGSSHMQAPLREALDGDYQLSGTVTLADAGLNISDMMLRWDRLQANGTLGMTLDDNPDIILDMKLGQVDLDDLLDRIISLDWQAPDTAQHRQETAPAAPDPVPDHARHARIKLASPALVYRGKVISDLALDTQISRQSIQLRQGKAQLPGGGEITLSGSFNHAATPPMLDGRITFDSDNLRSDLQWLDVDTRHIAKDRLLNLSLRARAKGNSARIDMSDVNIVLDQSRAQAAAAIVFGSRPGLGLNIDIDRLNLDAYTAKNDPAPGGVPAPGGMKEAMAWAGGIPDFGFDANISSRINALTVDKTVVRDVEIDVSLAKDRLVVNEIVMGNLAGFKTELTGAITTEEMLPALDLSFTAATSSLAGSLGALGSDMSSFAPGPLTLGGTIAGGLNTLKTQGTAQALGASLTWDGMLTSLILSPKADIALTLDVPSLGQCLTDLIPDYRPTGEPGPLKLAGRLAGDTQRLTLSDITGTLGSADVRASSDINLEGDKPHVGVTITAGNVAVDPFLSQPVRRKTNRASPLIKAALSTPPSPQRWSTQAYNTDLFHALDADVSLDAQKVSLGGYAIETPRMTARLKDGVVRITPATGVFFGGQAALDAEIDARSSPAVTATLSIDGADIGRLLKDTGHTPMATGKLKADVSVKGQGASPAHLVSSLAGQGALSVEDAELHGFDLTAISRRLSNVGNPDDLLRLLEAAFSGGRTPFTTVAGDFTASNGVITSRDIRLLSQAVEGKADLTINLPGHTMDADARFFLTDYAKAPPLGVRLTGPLDAPRRQLDTTAFEQYLLETIIGSLIEDFLPIPTGPADKPQNRDKPQNIEDSLRNILQDILP